MHNLSEQTNYGQVVQISCSRFVVKQAVCSDSYTTKHLVRGTLRPDETADNLPYEKVGNNEPVCIADEVPFEIPDSWEWVRLSVVAQLLDGKKINGESHPYLEAKYLRGRATPTIKTSGKYVKKNTKVILVDGENSGEVFTLSESGYLGSTFKVLYSTSEVYTDYLLLFILLQKQFLRQNKVGAAIPHLNKNIFFSLLFPLPPYEEQIRIVEQYNTLIPFIDNYGVLENKLDILNASFPELLKKSILQEAVQGKLVPQDPNDEPASVLLERIRAEKQALIKAGKIKKDKNESVIFRRDNSHYEKLNGIERCIDDEIPFEIPNNWCWVRLGTISTYAQKKEKINAKNAYPNIWELDLEDIEKGGKLLKKSNVSERKAVGDKTMFYKGNILYSKLRPYLLKIFVADENGICTPEIVPFDTYCNIYNEYIATYLKSPYVDNFINTITYGVKMPRVGTETMVDLFVPLPPVEEQHRIVATYKSILPALDQL